MSGNYKRIATINTRKNQREKIGAPPRPNAPAKKMLDLVETRNLVAKYLFASITPFVGLFRALESRETFAKL